MRDCATTLVSELSSNELMELRVILVYKKLKGIHLEIGTAAGGTLCELMCFYREKLKFSPKFIVVDPFKYFPNQYEKVLENLSIHNLASSSVDFVQSSSNDAFLVFSRAPRTLGFILIDGNHKAKYVMKDLRWAKYLSVGGILCLHDYSSLQKGVKLTTDRFLRTNLNYKILKHVDQLLIIEKTAETSTEEVRFADICYTSILSLKLQFEKSLQKRMRKLFLSKLKFGITGVFWPQ